MTHQRQDQAHGLGKPIAYSSISRDCLSESLQPPLEGQDLEFWDPDKDMRLPGYRVHIPPREPKSWSSPDGLFMPVEKQFVDCSVKECFQIQPPLVPVRIMWPAHDTSSTGPRPLEKINGGSRVEAMAIYKNMVPPDDRSDMEAKDWDTVVDIHNFLYGMAMSQMANDCHLGKLIQSCFSDLRSQVYHSPYAWQLSTTRRKEDNQLQFVDATFGKSTVSMADLKGRRFIAQHVFIDGHFVGAIIDRRAGQSYILDSLRGGRKARASVVTHVANNFLVRAGFDSGHESFVLPCTAQRGAWECGYIVSFWLITTIRGHVGVTIDEIDCGWSGSPRPAASTRSDLRLRDWARSFRPASHGRPPLDPTGSLLYVQEMLYCFACNFLGIGSMRFFTTDSRTGPAPLICPCLREPGKDITLKDIIEQVEQCAEYPLTMEGGFHEFMVKGGAHGMYGKRYGYIGPHRTFKAQGAKADWVRMPKRDILNGAPYSAEFWTSS